MKRCYGLALALLFVAGSAFADSKFEDNNPPGETLGSVCDTVALKLDGEQTLSPPVAIPDNAPAGVLVGQINVPNDGTTFINVVLAVRMAHTWIGDIVLQLQYFEDCQSSTPTAFTNVLCRPGGTNCGPGGTVGCSANFVAANELRYNDGAVAGVPSTSCASATNIAAGCYRPTGTGAGSMAVFAGRHKGGCFKLAAQDNAGLDTGSVSYWAVYSLNQNPTPATAATWGNVKNIYR
jgi:hypothetical protein